MASLRIRAARPSDAVVGAARSSTAGAQAEPDDAPTLVFVYGTLKEGFPNFARNPGRRVDGAYRTQQPYPLYVVQLPNEDRAPWLVDQPGAGHQVAGEVFEVDAASLAAMDAFEEVGLPGGYLRSDIVVEAIDAPHAMLRVQAYLKLPAQLAAGVLREGPFAAYTHALALGYRIDLG